MVLERRDLVGHCAEFVRVLEGRGAAVGSIDAFEGEVAASLTWSLAVTLDLSSFAFVASGRQSHASDVGWCVLYGTELEPYHAMEMYRLRFCFCCC